MKVHNKQHSSLEFQAELKNVLSKLRLILIERMVEPDDVHAAKNERGEFFMEYMKDTEHTTVYKSMQKTLTYLTRLDHADTRRIMTEKLKQFESTEWSWESFDSLCWAIGSISNSMPEENEKRFLFSVIEHLLLLCKQKKVQAAKGRSELIALSMINILAQYPHFLKAHWSLFKAVVDNLFDLMQVNHEDINMWACNLFLKICQRCFCPSNSNRETFAQNPFRDINLYIEKVLTIMPKIILSLKSDQQVQIFYEALGYMIAANSNQSLQQSFIERYLDLPNKLWKRILPAFQDEEDNLRYLSHILRINVRACRALGHLYALQLCGIYSDLLEVYVKISKNRIAALENDAENKNYILWMRTVQKDILNLISESVCHSKPPAMVSEFISTVLHDYQNCAVPAAREPEVLSTMARVINHLGKHMTNDLHKIFNSVFECTLIMINEDSVEFPEHRTHFYSLLGAIVNRCFPGLLKLEASQFKLIMDSVSLAIKHPLRNISKQGLHILYQLFQNIRSEERAAQSFYKTYYSDILQELLSVIADSFHSEDLPMQAYILAHMISIIKTNEFEPTTHPAGEVSSVEYIVQLFESWSKKMVKPTHSTISDKLRSEIKLAVEQFFENDQNFPAFLGHFKDFVIQIREELAGGDS